MQIRCNQAPVAPRLSGAARTALLLCQGGARRRSDLLRLSHHKLRLAPRDCGLASGDFRHAPRLLRLALRELRLVVHAVDIGRRGVAAAVEVEEGAADSSHAEEAAGAEVAVPVGRVDGVVDGALDGAQQGIGDLLVGLDKDFGGSRVHRHALGVTGNGVLGRLQVGQRALCGEDWRREDCQHVGQ